MSGGNGRAWVFGENVDTDQLAPGATLKGGIEETAKACLSRVDPEFSSKVKTGDFVVGGRNFGIGSSREQAAQALKHLGVAAVIAPSFGGIFYRNAFNFGLLALVCPEADKVSTGDELKVDPEGGKVNNLTTGETLACESIPAHLLEIVRAGGLVPYLAAQRR